MSLISSICNFFFFWLPNNGSGFKSTYIQKKKFIHLMTKNNHYKMNTIVFKFSYHRYKKKIEIKNLYIGGHSLYPIEISTGRVWIRTRVQEWTRVHYLTYPVKTSTEYKTHPR